MSPCRRRTLAAAACFACATLALAAPPPGGRVDPWILGRLAEAAPGARVGVLVELAERPELAGIQGTKLEKGAAVHRALAAVAARSQAPLLERLRELGVPHRPFWVANVVWVEADAALVAELAARPEVARLSGDAPVRVPETRQPEDPERVPEAPLAIEWGVAKVNADDVWALGYTGQGVVVGGQDTGYQWDHPALLAQYRGWNGASANHDFHWHDAIHAGGGVCGANSAFPCDDHNHGTHTMGTMVGDDGGANQIGVAPGAKWIGCRNMNVGDGTPSTYIECFQWFLAPTDLAGQNPNPALAPDVINNSWGCPTSEGCHSGNFAVMQAVVESLRAAGIVVVVSAGNSGSGCSSVTDPAAIYEASFTVGNTTSADNLASSSSRGPVTVDGSNRRKPDLSAPGTSVRSSIRNSSYGTFSGTSMAGPHVAGGVALLLSAHPALRGNVDVIEAVIERTANPAVNVTQTCGGIPSSQIPNNSFGWGRLDVLAAVQAVLLADDFEPGDFCRWDQVGEPPAPPAGCP